MRYLSKRFISILLSFTFIAISLVVYVNFIKPTYANIKADQGRLAVANQKNQEYEDVFGRLKGTLDELKKSPDLQNRVSMILPLAPNTSDSLNQVTSIASAKGLTIMSVDIGEGAVIPTAGANADSASIIKGIGILKNNMRAAGSYEQIKSFLQGVESGVRISSIKTFKADRNANATNPDMFTVTFEIETYYQVN